MHMRSPLGRITVPETRHSVMIEPAPKRRLDLSVSIIAVSCDRGAVSGPLIDEVADDVDRLTLGNLPLTLSTKGSESGEYFERISIAESYPKRCVLSTQPSRDRSEANCLKDVSRRFNSHGSACGIPQRVSRSPQTPRMCSAQLRSEVCGFTLPANLASETNTWRESNCTKRGIQHGVYPEDDSKEKRKAVSAKTISETNDMSLPCCECGIRLVLPCRCLSKNQSSAFNTRFDSSQFVFSGCDSCRTHGATSNDRICCKCRVSNFPPEKSRPGHKLCRICKRWNIEFCECVQASECRNSRLSRRGRPNVHIQRPSVAQNTSSRLGNILHLPLLWITILLIRFSKAGRTFSRKLSNEGFTSNFILLALWTVIILPGQSKRVYGNSLLVSPLEFCSRTRFLTARQQEICENQSQILKYVEEGVLLGSMRCQNEFQHSRWNCTHTPKLYYGRLLNQDIRETAYLNAVTSAAITYKVTVACSKGVLAECRCGNDGVTSYDLLKQEAQKRNLKVNESDLLRVAESFEWGGCGDKIDFGYRISRLFTDNFGRKYQSRDLKSLVEMHNFEAGRLAIKKHMKRECKCHGITGSCTLETCWNRMPRWLDVGENLRDRFDGAIRVHLGNDGRSLLPTRKQKFNEVQRLYPRIPHVANEIQRRFKRSPRDATDPVNVITDVTDASSSANRKRKKRFRRTRRDRRRRGGRKVVLSDEDLIFSQESPNFCRRIKKSGSAGTSGRVCNPYTTGAGSCEYLCCGRSYAQRKMTVTKKCNCRFEYCCQVICDKCTTQETIYICN